MRPYVRFAAGFLLDRAYCLPVCNLVITRRCNAGCVSCEYWRGKSVDELSLEQYRGIIAQLRRLRTCTVVLTGGEPLLRPDVFEIGRLSREGGFDTYLITNGILLPGCANEVAQVFDQVWISLDSHRAELHDRLRGVPCFEKVVAGIRLLKGAPRPPRIEIRSLIHRENFREVGEIADFVKGLGVDRISFLPVDVQSRAFGRDRTPAERGNLLLSADEVEEFADRVEQLMASHGDDLRAGLIRGGERELRWLVTHYRRYCGREGKPRFVNCLAPFISTVIDADGTVCPCYFLPPVGSILREPLDVILNNRAYGTVRRRFKRGALAECKLCVCPMRLRIALG